MKLLISNKTNIKILSASVLNDQWILQANIACSFILWKYAVSGEMLARKQTKCVPNKQQSKQPQQNSKEIL